MLVLSLFTGSVYCQEEIDIEKEKAAIIAVVEEKTDAFVDKDFDRLSNTFTQDETNIWLLAEESS